MATFSLPAGLSALSNCLWVCCFFVICTRLKLRRRWEFLFDESSLSQSPLFPQWSFYFRTCWQRAAETFRRARINDTLIRSACVAEASREDELHMVMVISSWRELRQLYKHLKWEQSRCACAFGLFWGPVEFVLMTFWNLSLFAYLKAASPNVSVKDFKGPIFYPFSYIYFSSHAPVG